MCHAGGHFAHGDQPTGRLGSFGLHLCLFFGLAPSGDVGGNHHLRQTAVNPAQVTRSDF